MPFQVIPAIDLRGGRCVRLFQGDYGRETVYGDDAAAMAQRWQSLGAPRLHVVDLDGARRGEQANAAAVREILGAVSVPVELGGGIRDMQTVERWLEAGLDRVYLGTAAVTDPAFAAEACARFAGHVAAGADARDGRIAVRGWEQDAGEDVLAFAQRMLAAGACALTYTNIAADGTMEGPDVEGVSRLLEALGDAATKAPIILAGGVGSNEDVLHAADVAGLGGVIVGRALYEGKVDLPAVLAAVASRLR
jgi:phosphoribosylformimino-5-aminoimidazole carboxamide ribotide isomerase